MNQELSPYFTTAEATFQARTYGYRYLIMALMIGSVILFLRISGFMVYDEQATSILVGFLTLICVVVLVGSLHELFIVPWRPYKKFILFCQAEDLLGQGDTLAQWQDAITTLRESEKLLSLLTDKSTMLELDHRYRLMADQLHRRQRPLLQEAFRKYGKPCPWQLPKPVTTRASWPYEA